MITSRFTLSRPPVIFDLPLVIYLNQNPKPMTNHFIVNYDTRKLQLHFEGEPFNFNLDDGDTGEFWNSFKMRGGTEMDINFSLEEGYPPQVCVYGLEEDEEGKLMINMSDETVITSHQAIGEPSDYLDYVDPNDMCPNCASGTWRNASGEMQCDNCGYSEGDE